MNKIPATINMMKNLFVLLFMYPFFFNGQSQMKNEKITQLVAAIEYNLYRNIIPFWTNHAVDHINGGFYGMVNAAGTGDATSPKAASLTARILWTFSALHRKDKDSTSLKTAQRAYKYLSSSFIDKEYGGIYYMVDSHGDVIADNKDIFAHAFAIYGLSEYYQATEDTEALEQAKAIFTILDQHAHDSIHGGYYESFKRDWSILGHNKTTSIILHEMEAFANLYRIWKSPLLENRLRELITIFLEKIINPVTRRQFCTFSANWTNLTIPNESYGLDIQGAWLPFACAGILGHQDLIERCEKASLSMAEATLVALQPDGRMIAESINGKPVNSLPWWIPAEAVVGFVNAWQLTGDQAWINRALLVWQYTDRVLVDKEYGEWFYGLDRNGNVDKNSPKVNEWKCPFHNTRMCLEVIQRLRQ
jgi:mannobiose 2-epimerase